MVLNGREQDEHMFSPEADQQGCGRLAHLDSIRGCRSSWCGRFVAEEFLDGTNVVSILEKVSGKAVVERVAGLGVSW